MVNEMTSRQRLQNALERKPVDKLCFDLGSGQQTGMGACAVHRLREAIFSDLIIIQKSYSNLFNILIMISEHVDSYSRISFLRRVIMSGKLAKIGAFIMLLGVLVLFQGCSPIQTNEPGSDFVDTLVRASVEVLADGKMAGSGAFVSSDGYVLTAAHYITSPEMKLEVLSDAAGRKSAALIGSDKGHDMALLKIETKKKLPFLTVSERAPVPGQTVYVIGSPLNRHGLLMRGMVASRQANYEHLTDQDAYVHIWYLKAMSPRGLSGGNWVNDDGEIIGVQSGWINEQIAGTNGQANSGIAFIAGPEAIRRLVESKKHADTPLIGGVVEELWTQAPGFQKRFNEGAEGIVIHQVRAGGPLEKAGLVHEDLIVKADGKKVRYRRELLDIVRGKKPGDTIRIDYIKPDNKGAGKKEIVLDSLEKNWLQRNTTEKKAEETTSE
jgi:S1-C subfamily serine protease